MNTVLNSPPGIIMKNSIPVIAPLSRLAPRRKDSAPRKLALAGLVLLALLAGSAQAQISKANNTDNLILGSSWVGGTAPGSGDTAQWDNTVTSANTTVLGADTNWSEIVIADPGGLVTINAGNTLTLGGSVSIDMSLGGTGSATADLILNCGVNLPLNTTWLVPGWIVSGSPVPYRTLTVGGPLSGSGNMTMPNQCGDRGLERRRLQLLGGC